MDENYNPNYQQYPPQQPQYSPQPQPSSSGKSKIAAGVLGILLGHLGIHKFYLGYTREAVIMLVVTVVCACASAFTLGFSALGAGAMAIIGIIEGILYLTKSDQEFDQIYVYGRKPWF
jgi:TM2 domain-containing membrane protein YozV